MGSVVVVVPGSFDSPDRVVVVVGLPSFDVVEVVVTEVVELVVVPPIVIEPFSNFTFEVTLTPFSALTVVSFHSTAYVPAAQFSGISNVSVMITVPSASALPVVLAKR